MVEIVIVKEDLKTIVPISSQLGSIDANDDFYTLRRIAQEMKLSFIATIDEAGYTIINELQRLPFAQEIEVLRTRPEVNQKILDILEQAVQAVEKAGCQYIKFMGD